MIGEVFMSCENLPSVTVKEFTDIIKMQLEEDNYRPVFGLGKGGIGKTESLKDLAVNDLGIGYIDIRLLLYTETDLKGIPYPDETHTKTIWLQNNILPIAERDGERGILVLDEITSANRSIRTAAYQLLNERKLGEYILPDKWLIVCIGNGEEDGGDYQGMEGNFANRCSVFNVVPNVEAWKDWAIANGVNPLVIGYITFKPQDLHSFNPEAENDILFASPRSWKAVSDILNKHEFDEGNNILIRRIVASIGHRVGYSFVAYCKLKNKVIDPYRIVNNGEMPVVNGFEITTITIQSVIKIIGDLIKEDVRNTHEISSVTVGKLANAIKWIISLKVEYAVMGIKDLIRYKPDIISKVLLNSQFHQYCPDFMKFVKNNSNIFN